MKDFIKKMLLDESDSPSTKRIIAMVGSFIMFSALFCGVFTDIAFAPSSELITGCVTIICVCLGSSTIDKFSKK
jgi:hypothetical protein